jgi:hypothetical protein
MLEKSGGDQLDHSLEKWRGIKEEKNIQHAVKRRESKWIGHILRRKCLLKLVIERKKWRAEEEEDVNSYRMALRKREGTGA